MDPSALSTILWYYILWIGLGLAYIWSFNIPLFDPSLDWRELYTFAPYLINSLITWISLLFLFLIFLKIYSLFKSWIYRFAAVLCDYMLSDSCMELNWVNNLCSIWFLCKVKWVFEWLSLNHFRDFFCFYFLFFRIDYLMMCCCRQDLRERERAPRFTSVRTD